MTKDEMRTKRDGFAKKRDELVAMLNQVAGAIAVLDELIAAPEPTRAERRRQK